MFNHIARSMLPLCVFPSIYYSHNSNIKYIAFEPIHYTINLDIVLSFMIFSEFDYVFLH